MNKQEKLNLLLGIEDDNIISLEEVIELIKNANDEDGYILLQENKNINKKTKKKLKKSGFVVSALIKPNLVNYIKITWNTNHKTTWTY